MHPTPTYTSWKITCRSLEEAQSLQHWLSSRIDLKRVWKDDIRITPNGIEKLQTVEHRLGDYFVDIRLLDVSPTGFRLVFHKQPQAGRFWKDLMVNILQEIENAPQKPSLLLEKKGEMEPIS
jgi:hypothetical protein